MELYPDAVQVANIEKIWPEVGPILEKALEQTPLSARKLTPDEVLKDLLQSKKQLWLAHDNNSIHIVMVTEIKEDLETNEKWCQIFSLSGKNLRDAFLPLENVKVWAKQCGASKIKAETRLAVFRIVRKAGFKFVQETPEGRVCIELIL